MRESFPPASQETPKRRTEAALSATAKDLVASLKRRSALLQPLLMFVGLQAAIYGAKQKLDSRLREEDASAVLQNVPPERLQRLREIYGQDLLQRLRLSVHQGEEARQARTRLPEGQPAQLQVHRFEALGYRNETVQRFFTTMYPREMSSSTTIFSVTRTERQIPMGYGMVGYEGGHCTRSLRGENEAARGSEIVITPEGFPSEEHVSPTRAFAHVLLHEGAHANDPLDSPDMPERLRIEAMTWLGERVVHMDDRSRPSLDAETPAGQGFLRFTYPFAITTPDKQRRNEDRAVEYWAELVSTVQTLAPGLQASGNASWEERTARRLALEVGSGIQGRSQERLVADALEHVRFLRRVLPEMDFESLQQRYHEQERTLAWERFDHLVEERVYARIDSAEIRALFRGMVEHPRDRDTELAILSTADPDEVGAETNATGDTLFVMPDSRLDPEDREIRQAIRWAAEARQREFDAIVHGLSADERRWIETDWPQIRQVLYGLGQTRGAGFEAAIRRSWPGLSAGLNVRLRNPAVREAITRLVGWWNQEAVGPSSLPAVHREQVERMLGRMRKDPEYLRSHIVLLPG